MRRALVENHAYVVNHDPLIPPQTVHQVTRWTQQGEGPNPLYLLSWDEYSEQVWQDLPAVTGYNGAWRLERLHTKTTE